VVFNGRHFGLVIPGCIQTQNLDWSLLITPNSITHQTQISQLSQHDNNHNTFLPDHLSKKKPITTLSIAVCQNRFGLNSSQHQICLYWLLGASLKIIFIVLQLGVHGRQNNLIAWTLCICLCLNTFTLAFSITTIRHILVSTCVWCYHEKVHSSISIKETYLNWRGSRRNLPARNLLRCLPKDLALLCKLDFVDHHRPKGKNEVKTSTTNSLQ
jgi:hypothetical protein